jgi:hypothetical protein
MKYVVGMLIGFGAGLVAGGVLAIFSPFRWDVTTFGIVGLGFGLLVGGLVALIAIAQRKSSSLPGGATGGPAGVPTREQP